MRKRKKYNIVASDDLEGLINLALKQTSSFQTQTMDLSEGQIDDTVTVEQVIEEREYEDGTIEKSIATSFITIIDSETKQPVTRSQLQEGYEVRLNANFSAIQTIYASKIVDGLSLSKIRCDRSAMVIYGAPNSIVRATQRLWIDEPLAILESHTMDISQSQSNPVYGQVYTLNSTNTNWYSPITTVIIGNLDVLLTDGHGGRSEYTLFTQHANPPSIQYY